MKILLISTNGDGLGIGAKIANDSHEVNFYISDEKRLTAGMGFVNRTPDYRPFLRSSDLVISLNPGFGSWERKLKALKVRTFGCSLFADALVNNPVRVQELFNKARIKTPSTIITSEITDLLDNVLNWERGIKIVRYKGRTIQCTHKDFLAWAIPTVPIGEKVCIQEYVPGLPATVFGFFNGRNWVDPTFIAMEREHAALVMQDTHKKLRKQFLDPLVPILRKIDFRGMLSVGVRFSSQGNEAYAVSLSLALHYPTIYAVLEGLKPGISVSDMFYELADGSLNDLDVTFDSMGAVLVRTLDPASEGSPIIGLESGNLKHIYFDDVQRVNDTYFLAGDSDKVYVATAHGRSFDETRNRVNETIRRVDIVEESYSPEALRLLSLDFNRIRQWGYA